MSDFDDFLEHYGVKGMKWGVRKDRDKAPSARRQRYEAILNAPSRTIQVTAKNGKVVDVVEDRNDKVTALFMSLSKKGVERNAAARDRSPSFKFFVEGKHVGEASFFKGGRNGDDPTELNLVWLGVRKNQRGQGYGSAVFDAAVEYGKQTGAKKLTLEVPGNSPDARHIYEKRGFVVTHEPTAKQAKADPTWGGLTDMELDLTKLSHASTEDDEELERALIQSFPQLDDEQEETVFGQLAHIETFDDFLEHYGVKGMKWGVRKDRDGTGSYGPAVKDPLKSPALAAKAKLFSIGVKLAPRELEYSVKRALSNPSADDRLLAEAAFESSKSRGVLPNVKRLSDAIEKIGIEKHKAATYDLDDTDLDRLKKYTDAAWYSRSINGYLATGQPKEYGPRAQQLKETLSKSTVTDTTVYRSTSLNFSFNGVAKKLDNMSEEELAKSFDSFSKNYKGKSFKENRVFSTSTSPNFAIDTWRAVNPNAAANYNTYMIINTKNTPGLLADGRTTSGKKIVNTRSNQEAILAPSRMRYESLTYDQERGMFAITVTALGDDD